MKITDIHEGEYAPYQKGYMSLVSPEWPLVEELEVSVNNFVHFVREIPMDKFDYRYAPGKWTIKDIIQHLIDSERIFAYRALRFSRGDTTALPGFDENLFAKNARGNERHLTALLNELSLVRHTTIALFKSLNDEELKRTGQASGYTISVRALGFAIIGHQNHHQKVFEERYL
jgi:uncharacterized damage-inducible protein DinB